MTMVGELIASVTLFGAVATAVWKWNRDRRDSGRIFDFMLDSHVGTDWKFRKKEAISSHLKLSPDRVVTLCTKLCQQGKLRRNEKEADSWTLAK